MSKKAKDILVLVFIIALVAVCAIWFLTDDLEHIEDTNGADERSLTTITDENIINMDMGSLNVKKSTGILSDGVTFSSDKFTGVYEIFLTNYILPSDLLIDLTGFEVTGGNFKMVVVNNDEIVATVEPGTFAECHLEDLTGTTALRIAGESASFSFYLDKLFCEQYDITVS